MSQRKTFPFDEDKWLSGTVDMTFEERGVYLHLLIRQSKKGFGLTKEEIGESVPRDTLIKCWSKIKDKFPIVNGVYENKYMKNIIDKRKPPTGAAKKIFTPPTIEEVIQYFINNGYRKDAAVKFYNYYNSGDPPWSDSKGQKVASWKQKAQVIWFKPEHKDTSKNVPLKK